MELRRLLWVLGMALLAHGLTGQAQSLVGEYNGTVLLGDTSGEIMPAEFVQSLDLALSIRRSESGGYTGSLRFRRFFRDPETGGFAEAQGPLISLVIDGDWNFEATSAPIRFRSGGRLIERVVSLSGQFMVAEGQCLPTVQADYTETLRGLIFRPLTLSGPLLMARKTDTPEDADCLGQPLSQ